MSHADPPVPLPSPPADRTGGPVPSDGFVVAARDRGMGQFRRDGDGSLARPVAIDLPRAQAEAVRRWVEGVLGWQPVDGSTARLVPPTVRLVGPASSPIDDAVPRVLLVPEDTGAAAAATAAIRTGAIGAIAWPDDRERLADVVANAVDRSPVRADDRRVVRVGGVAGGVGTTTVVLGLAGLAGWSGLPALAALRGDAPVAEVTVVPAEATSAADLWNRVTAPPGTRELRVVHVADPAPIAVPTDPTIGLAVLDQGVDLDVDVVVCRPDAAALERLPSTTAAAIVVVGSGPVSPRELAAVAGGRRGIQLPWSVRVARAGRHRRVPGALPGAWLRRLEPLLPNEVRRS